LNKLVQSLFTNALPYISELPTVTNHQHMYGRLHLLKNLICVNEQIYALIVHKTTQEPNCIYFRSIDYLWSKPSNIHSIWSNSDMAFLYAPFNCNLTNCLVHYD